MTNFPINLSSSKVTIEILKRYKQRLDESCSNQLDADKEAFDLAIKALDSQWTPTSEMLPEEYGCYLVMWRHLTEGYPDRLFYEICEYEPEVDEWEKIEQAGDAGAEIVAWMPLPEPYKKGGDQ